MQPSETFLYVWSIGASVTASYFYYKSKVAERDAQVLMQTIVDIHDGNAKVIKNGGQKIIGYQNKERLFTLQLIQISLKSCKTF